MSINPNKRNCSAVCKNGHPCRQWAMINSDPPLCSVHAGRNIGAGAPIGNRNALKHGLYARAIRPEDIASLEMVESGSLKHEFVLARIALLRMSGILAKPDLPQAELLAIAKPMATLMRAALQLYNNISERGFDWNAVLDEVAANWDFDI